MTWNIDNVRRCRAYNSVNQAIGAGGWTQPLLNSSSYDPSGMNTGAAIAAKHDGVWHVGGVVLWLAPGGAVTIGMRLLVSTVSSGVIILSEETDEQAVGQSKSFNLSSDYQCRAGDTFYMQVFCSLAHTISGSSFNANYGTALWAHSVGTTFNEVNIL